MHENILIGLVNNAALLMALGLIYDTVCRRNGTSDSTLYQVASGLTIGGLAVVLMLTPVRWEPGVIFDARTILLGMTGLFFGAIPTFIAMAIAAAYRLNLGGGGVVMGVATIISSCMIGLAWRHYRFRRLQELSLAELYLFGIVVHVVMILCMLLLPQGLIRLFINNLALPVIIIFPIGTALLGTLLSSRQRRLRIEKEVRENEERFRSIIELAVDAILLGDMEGSIVGANESATSLTGYGKEELVGMNIVSLFSEEERLRSPFRYDLLKAGATVKNERCLTRKDGATVPIEMNSKMMPNGSYQSFLRDMTERKRAEDERLNLEQQLLHAQKLESLGVLAGGIAHDFNNILTAIIGNADLALMRLNPESPAVDNLRRIERAAARAADLAKQMLAYSGKGKFMVEKLDLNRLLEEMLHMLEVSISSNAVLRLNLHEQIPSVEADATQMRQIVMNLVINASEAIGDKSGVIAITTGCMDCDRSYLKDVWLDENLNVGLYVYLEIADSGCGMERDTMAKLFDPFFTTKFTGRGLGMAAVLGIVRGHKGAIKVYSEPGKGASIKILLPARCQPAAVMNGNIL